MHFSFSTENYLFLLKYKRTFHTYCYYNKSTKKNKNSKWLHVLISKIFAREK